MISCALRELSILGTLPNANNARSSRGRRAERREVGRPGFKSISHGPAPNGKHQTPSTTCLGSGGGRIGVARGRRRALGIGRRERGERVVVVRLWVCIEGISLRLEINDGLAVAHESTAHVSAGGEVHRELVHARRHLERLRCRIRGVQCQCRGCRREDDGPEHVLVKLEVVRLADRIGCIGGARVWAGPEVEFVLRDRRVRTRLVTGGEVAGHI